MTYKEAEEKLKNKGFRVVVHITKSTLVDGLEVPVSPILMDDKVQEIKELLPDFRVSGMRNEQYVLIKEIKNE